MAIARDPSIDQLAAEQIDDTDVRVLTALAGLFEALDPVPAGLVERIQFGITLDALHSEIAELQRASGLVGVRGDESTDAQTITFASASLTTMVTITPTLADRVRIDGWIAPGTAIDIELRLVGGSRRVTTDDDGRFAFDDVPRGFAQFVLRRPGTAALPTVVTPSIEL